MINEVNCMCMSSVAIHVNSKVFDSLFPDSILKEAVANLCHYVTIKLK